MVSRLPGALPFKLDIAMLTAVLAATVSVESANERPDATVDSDGMTVVIMVEIEAAWLIRADTSMERAVLSATFDVLNEDTAVLAMVDNDVA